MSTPRIGFTRFCLGIGATLTLAACGGGSDDSSGDGAAPTSDALAAVNGTIDSLVGDASTNFTIMLPERFAATEPASATTPRFEDASLEFGERNTRVELLYLPTPSTAQALIDDWMTVNSTITVIDQADEDGVSWFTFTTPSTSDEGKISFGTATTSLTLADGTGLQCRALTQNGIDEEWDAADAAAIAAANLATCRSLTAG